MFFTYPSFLMKMRKISVFHWHVLEVLIFVGSSRLRQLDVFCKNLFQICANIQCIPVQIHWCTNAYHIQPITIFTITPSLILDKFIFLYTFLWNSFSNLCNGSPLLQIHWFTNHDFHNHAIADSRWVHLCVQHQLPAVAGTPTFFPPHRRILLLGGAVWGDKFYVCHKFCRQLPVR